MSIFFCVQLLSIAQSDSSKHDFDQLDPSMLQQGMIRNISEALQSVSPDLMISHPGANPNLTVDMTYRGLNTLRLNVRPQFFLNGMPVFNPDMLDPLMIGKVNLPELQRSAQHAFLAGSGLFDLTTHSNQREGWQLTLRQQASAEQLVRSYEVLSSVEFRRYALESNDFGEDTDWLEVVSRLGITNQTFLQSGYKNDWLDFTASGSFQDVNAIQRKAGHRLVNGLSKFKINLPKYGLRLSASGMLQSRNADIGATSVFHGAIGMNPTVGLNENPSIFYLFGGNPNLLIENQERKREEIQSGLRGAVEWDVTSNTMIAASYSRSHYQKEEWELLNAISEPINNYSFGNAYEERSWQFLDLSISRSWSIQETYHSLTARYQGQQFDKNKDEYYESAWSNGAAFFWESDTTEGRFNTNAYQLDYELSGSALRAYGFIRSSASSNLGADVGRQLFFGGEVSYDLGWIKPFATFSKLGMLPLESGLSRLQDRIYYTSDGLQVERVLYDNPNLKSEVTNSFEIGSNFRISERLELRTTYYNSTSSDLMDLLTLYNAERWSIFLPLNSIPAWVNFAKIRNTGFNIEASLRSVEVGPVRVQQSGFIGFRKSILEDLNYDQFNSYDGSRLFVTFNMRDLAINWLEEGEAVGQLYLPKFIGATDDGRWSLEMETDRPGNFVNAPRGNGLPTTQIGSLTQLDYQDWSLSFRLRAAIGHSIYNTTRVFYQNLDNSGSWNRLTSFSKIEEIGVTEPFNIGSDYFLEKSSFLQLSYLSLSRRFEFEQLGQITFQGTVNNLFTLTGYSGSDPDVRMSSGHENSQRMGFTPALNNFLIGTDSPATWPLSRAFTLTVLYSF